MADNPPFHSKPGSAADVPDTAPNASPKAAPLPDPGAPFRLRILGSGSGGNAAVLETPGCRLLVDCGMSARQVTLRLAAAGLAPGDLSGILLTHEHHDHVSALRVLCKATPLPVFCTRLTAEVLRRDSLKAHPDVRQFQPGGEFSIGDLDLRTFNVPHDAVDPIGFVAHHGGRMLGFLTDLGKCTTLVRERIREAHTLVIETNHDEKTLQDDPKRPWALKQRIMSIHGHLSNAAAAVEIEALLQRRNGLRRAILCHLSRDCNSPAMAAGEVRRKLAEADAETEVALHCAAQGEPSPAFEV